MHSSLPGLTRLEQMFLVALADTVATTSAEVPSSTDQQYTGQSICWASGLKPKGCRPNPQPGTMVEVPLSKALNPSLVPQAAHRSRLVCTCTYLMKRLVLCFC